jgi:hypothetical protein
MHRNKSQLKVDLSTKVRHSAENCSVFQEKKILEDAWIDRLHYNVGFAGKKCYSN